MATLNNPLIDEVLAKRALQTGMGVPQGEVDQPQPRTLAAPPAAPQRPLLKAPAPNEAEQAHQTEYNRLTGAGPNAQEGRPGWEQIHNPVGKTLAGIGNAVASFFPAISMNIPGTTMHHQFLVHNERQALEHEQKARKDTAEEERDVATANKMENAGETPHTVTTADGVKQFNPATGRYDITVGGVPTKAESVGRTITTDQGIMQFNPTTGRYDIQAGKAPDKQTGTVHQLEDGTLIIAHPNGKATPVTIDGQPAKGKVTEHTENAEQQFVDEYLKAHAGATIAQAQHAYAQNRQLPPQRDPDVALDREVTHYSKPFQTALTAADQQLDRIREAQAMLHSGSAEAQALAVPKVLTALVSGQGTGVRITQPELDSIASARGIKGGFQAFIQKIETGQRLTPQQSQDLQGILSDIEQRVMQKQSIHNGALDRINGARSREEMIQADKEARKALADLEKGGMPRSIGIPYTDNGRTYNIPPNEEKEFLKDHPKAKKANAR